MTTHYLGDVCRGIVTALKGRSSEAQSDSLLQGGRSSCAWSEMKALETAIQKLVRVLERERLGDQAKSTVYRWLLSQKLALDEKNLDPTLPTSQQKNVGIQYYLKGKGLTLALIDSIEREFATIIGEALASKRPNKLMNKEVVVSQVSDYYRVDVRGVSFTLTSYRYQKLKNKYNGPIGEFSYCVALVLMRYEPLTMLCSGYSGGCPVHLFDSFKKELGTTWELFSSPLNYTLDDYLSPHGDTDMCFGSKGSFFDHFYKLAAAGGSFELNPPFTEEYLSVTTDMVLETLTQYDQVPLTFVYIHPTWTDLYGYRDMKTSQHLVAELCFSARTHYYESGMQHNPQYRKQVCSSAPSTIFLLQNQYARTHHPISIESIDKIRKAFSQRFRV